MESKTVVQEDQIADMLLFMEKLPPEFTPGDHSPIDFSGDIQNPNPFTTATAPVSPSLIPSENRLESRSSMADMREMIFRIAAMQPIDIDPETVRPPKRKNVRISQDPQSVAARHRRERISHRIRILQRLVPGGTKMDTASMLDEAIHYVKFLKTQVQSLQTAAGNRLPPEHGGGDLGFPVMKYDQHQCNDPFVMDA